MSNILSVRNALVTALSGVEIGGQELQIEAYRSDQIQPPSMIIEPQQVAWDTAMQRGHDAWFLNLRLLIGTATNSDGLRLRDQAFIGATDIKNAIESYVPLRDGSVADDVFVRQARNFGVWEISAVAYIGVEFATEVIVRT